MDAIATRGSFTTVEELSAGGMETSMVLAVVFPHLWHGGGKGSAEQSFLLHETLDKFKQCLKQKTGQEGPVQRAG